MIATIAGFLGMIIRIIYNLVNNNYFLSIIIFTIITKLILFPLTLKQMKSTEEMKKIAPKDKLIREKFKNDKAKQSEELTKLYSEHKINPLGGCLPLLIQLPIIFAMFYIVKQPLTYIAQIPQEQIKVYTQELLVKDNVNTNEMQQNEILIANKKEIINMNVGLGINLGNIPSKAFDKDSSTRVPIISLMIPLLAILFSAIQLKLSMKNSITSDEQKEMQKTTNIMMPLLSGFISYTMPLALGVYWLFGNILQIIQQIIIDKLISKKEEKLKLDKGGAINEKN